MCKERDKVPQENDKMTGKEAYETTEEGKAVFKAGDLIFEAFEKIEEAAKLMGCVEGVECMKDLLTRTKAEVRVLGDLSDAWTEQSFARIGELFPGDEVD